MYRILLIFSLLSIPSLNFSQDNLLDDPQALEVIHSGLNASYAGNFELAESSIELVRKKYPLHPVIPFLEALNLYWKNFPINPASVEAESFNKAILECLDKAKIRIERDSDDLEGIFFDLFGRAYYCMYWSDNGKTSKVFPHLNSMYRNTMKGFDLKEVFSEFYFSTGLFNYYIEAYPEKHPVYKPIASLFSRGNKKLGLQQLEYCAGHSIYVKFEALYFLSHIYMNYEEDFDKASEYASKLYKEFPDNSFYTANYLEILLFNKKYFMIPLLLQKLEIQENQFSLAMKQLFTGMYTEKKDNNTEKAIAEYQNSLEKLAYLGEYGTHYRSIAYMGLFRCYSKNGFTSQAKKYQKLARSSTSFGYILNDK